MRKILLCLFSFLSFIPSITFASANDPLKIAMLIPGNIDDGGFMEAGYNGLLKIKKELELETSYIDKIQPKKELLINALRELAKKNPDMIIAHGGQNSQAVQAISNDYPDIKFVVVQGHVTGKNISSYEVLQEESAWLAGAAAGMLTETNIVGHISGIRVTPGLKGRAAFADGLKYTNPNATFLTNFCGYQDDSDIAYKVATSQIKAGADIIFTMLNSGRTGATKAMEENKVKQFGNVVDWYPTNPKVFAGSAIANVSMGSFQAAKDLKTGKWEANTINQIGLEDNNSVSLALAPYVSDEIKEKINTLRKEIVDGKIVVSIEYTGPEFQF